MKTIKPSNTKVITLAAVAAVCLASALGARAEETAAGVPALTVHYSDLNLDTPKGAAVLYQRIRNAAGRVCGDLDSRQIERIAAAKACVDQAMLTGVRAVNNPMLTNEYNNRVGKMQKQISVASVR